MKAVVLDASFALALVLPDEDSAAAESLIRESDKEGNALIAPFHWPLEIANGLLQATRRKRMSREDRIIAGDFLLGLPVTIVDEIPPIAELFPLCDEQDLSIYDATYLALSARRGVRIATTDGPLREAARRLGLLWSPRGPRIR